MILIAKITLKTEAGEYQIPKYFFQINLLFSEIEEDCDIHDY